MNKSVVFFVVMLIFTACSTGKKALQKGDYFSAVSKAVERLKSDPTNENATTVLKEGYPLAINWSQEEMDLALSTNEMFKWERAIDLMKQVNMLSELIRSTPAARKLIQNPKSYTSELNLAHEKAAEERYNAGLQYLDQNTREAARSAFVHFQKTEQLMPGFKEVYKKLETAKVLATTVVIVEAVVVHTKKYQLSSEFFFDQVFEYLNNKYPKNAFVNFYATQQAEELQIKQPDFIVRMEFYDFSVGNLSRSEKEEELVKRVKIESKDTLRVQYNTYRAKLKTYTDEVVSGGRLNVKIVDFAANEIQSDRLFPGSFTWVNTYAIFAGDKEALDQNQLQLTQRKALPLPPEQDLFVEFTRPIYEQTTSYINQFFRRFN